MAMNELVFEVAPAQSAPDLRLLTAGDLAEEWRMDKSFIYRLMQRGEIPTVRIGRCIRVRPADAEKFINARVGA